MSVPCAIRDGLPIGMMLVGRWYDEPTSYSVAHAFEQATDWRGMVADRPRDGPLLALTGLSGRKHFDDGDRPSL